MPLTYLKLAQYDVSASAGVSTIEFTNIPQSFDDLIVHASLRTSGSNVDGGLGVNNISTVSYLYRVIYGNGASAASGGGTASANRGLLVDKSADTASTFASHYIYFPNYSSTTIKKSISVDGAMEHNGTTAFQGFFSILYDSTDAITRIDFRTTDSSNYVQHSTATLYGIKRT